MYSVGGLVGSLIYGWICDKVGRKGALRTITVPQLLSFILVAFATDSRTILISRLVVGISGGGLYICIPLYVSEIAEDV